ncbi:MAG: L,D-transpeptidase [Gammaproteobacteria bacterium]|nr:L,D-transpeptidase [Gammaproteobacteria bacterium]
MRSIRSCVSVLAFSLLTVMLSSCANRYDSSGPYYPADDQPGSHREAERQPAPPPPNYAERLPQHIATRDKAVLVDPNVHAWGAYRDGELIKAGLATAGSNWCPDLGRPCHTHAGTYRVNSLGSPNCKSSMFPIPKGGAPMPYCMFFNRNQALHGSGEREVIEGNISHGCVRMHVSDAEWLRYNFVNVGTKVIVKPY